MSIHADFGSTFEHHVQYKKNSLHFLERKNTSLKHSVTTSTEEPKTTMKYPFLVILTTLTAAADAFQQAHSPMNFSVGGDSSSREFVFRTSPQSLLLHRDNSSHDGGHHFSELTSRRASDSSSFDSLGSVFFSKAELLVDTFKGKVITLADPLSKTHETSLELFQKSWWMLPMILALVPPYFMVTKGTLARMPHWWQVVRMDHIVSSGASALAAVGVFLFSNISFFLVGGYLMYQFPPTLQQNQNDAQDDFQQKKMGLPMPTRYTMLSVWMLAAGIISTVFHSVQAFGSYPIAESLCYIDHGVAFSSVFYFWDVCGRPSWQVLGLGALAFASLCITSTGYVWFHSAWHFFISMAAGLWASQGCKDQMRRSSLGLVGTEKRQIPAIAQFVVYTAVRARLHSQRNLPNQHTS